MRIAYPYNEILPRKKAHDVYIFQECVALAALGIEMHLLCGKGSSNLSDLSLHYATEIPKTLHFKTLPIIRKHPLFHISWNRPFFFYTQRMLKKLHPDWVFLSVRKQADYHLRRKIPGIRYLYEVHELSYYPTQEKPSQFFENEHALLSRADLITVTTEPLKEILRAPPYSLKVPIEIVPLGVHQHPLPPPSFTTPFTCMYVGQLYKEQGLSTLLYALSLVKEVYLKIVGGSALEIACLKKECARLKIESRVTFLGFIPPAHLSLYAQEAHAFVAPFESSGRMPYVAHTKLFEYAAWGRPFIAPHLPVVSEHFKEEPGVVLYKPDCPLALAQALLRLKDETSLYQPQSSQRFTWQKRAERYNSFLHL